MNKAMDNHHQVLLVQQSAQWVIRNDRRTDRMQAVAQQMLRCSVKVVIKIHPIYRHVQAVHRHHHPHRHLCGRNQSDNMLKHYLDVRHRRLSFLPEFCPFLIVSMQKLFEFSHAVEFRLVFVTPFTNLFVSFYLIIHFHFTLIFCMF